VTFYIKAIIAMNLGEGNHFKWLHQHGVIENYNLER